ncbi:glycosyltransferase family 39 protein [Streptomyces acidicola]|nr:glycosyltransferase family 39 protein [Streptomyces acidicola]
MSHDQQKPRLSVVHEKAGAPDGATAPAETAASPETTAQAEQRPDENLSVAKGRFPPLGRKGRMSLVFAMVTGLVTHAWHLFQYPLYLTDEGIYMQRAWSLIRETRLSPYTYSYDHAPGGWITLAGWAYPLPKQFETFGNAINTGRFLMLLVHIASVYLLFEVTRRLSGSVLAASVSAFFYNVSPLAVYFQRQVLLDNMMMFWVLLGLLALLRPEFRIKDAVGGGMALGIGLITKENALFFVPAFLYLLHRRIKGTSNLRFTQMFWPFTMLIPVGGYLMYATLKNELLPSGLSFNLNSPPTEHVSLLYTAWWQVNRTEGKLFSHEGLLYQSWLFRDAFFLYVGVVAMALCLLWGLKDRNRDLGFLISGALSFGYFFYLLRGSVVLDFYVAPLIPMFAINIGMATDRVMKWMRPMLKQGGPVYRGLRVGLPCFVIALLIMSPTSGYLMTTNTEGRVKLADQYDPKLNLTALQGQQVEWIRKHIPPDARIITDDDIWMMLHDVRPFYPYAHSHWNAASDPAVRDKLFRKKWQNIDYIIMSNKMRKSIDDNNGDGRENWILQGLRNSKRVWYIQRGDIKLEIYRVE